MVKVAAGFLILLATFGMVSEASAVECVRGVARASCAGPNGAVVARRPAAAPAAVVAPVARPACAIVNGARVCR